MKHYYHILILKRQIITLKRRRREMVVSICVNHKKEAGRVDNVEDVFPDFFKKTDKEILIRERLVRFLNHKHFNTSNIIVPLF